MNIQKKKYLLLWVCAATLIICLPLSGFAQVNLNNFNTYTQNFNTLTSSTSQSYFTNNATLPGWYLQHEIHRSSSYPIFGNDGSNPALNFYSYGNSVSTERALGGMANGIDAGSGYIAFRVKNNTGKIIRNFEISYTLEQWYNSGKAAKFDFSYAVKPVGTSITSPLESAATWINVDDMDVQTPSTTSPTGKKNGNDASHRVNKKYTLIEINLQPGQEIMLRWQYITVGTTNGNGLALDDVSVTPQVNVFYANQEGKLNELETWTRDKNGTGGNPSGFSVSDQVFHITQGSGRELDATMALGTNSKIVIGDGVNPVSVSVKKNSAFKGKIDVLNHGTLILTNTVNPELGKLSDESTVIYEGGNTSTAQTVESEAYGNLILRGSNPKRLSKSILVNGNLTLHGSKLVLGNHNLTLNKNKVLTGGNSNSYFVTDGNGNLCLTVPRTNTEILFPVGNSSYNPVVLKQSPSGAEDVFKVRVLDAIYSKYGQNEAPLGEPYTEKAVNRTWLVNEEVPGGSDVFMKVYYGNSHSLTGFVAEKSYLSHYTNNSWDEPAAGNVGTEGDLFAFSREGITSFSPFGIFTSETLLPVELFHFDASYSNGVVKLDWATMSETNNDYFTLESSRDGMNFFKLAKIDGAGSSVKKNHYHFEDDRFLEGQEYYRLIQTDFDGTTTYSHIASAYVPVRNITAPFPNPTASFVNIPVSFDSDEVSTISIQDLDVNAIISEKVSRGDDKPFVLDISELAPDVYIIKVQSSLDTKIYKVVKISNCLAISKKSFLKEVVEKKTTTASIGITMRFRNKCFITNGFIFIGTPCLKIFQTIGSFLFLLREMLVFLCQCTKS